MDCIPFGDRVILLKLATTYRTMTVIQAYAPTGDKSDDDIEGFYSTLDEASNLTKKGEITVVLGDFNAKIGKGKEGDVCGQYGLGVRNTRGQRLVQFCVEQQLSAVNTFFKQHPRRLYTWKSPADCTDHRVRNQIDFILIKKLLLKYVKTAKTYPGADVRSDHNPVVIELRMRRFVGTNCKRKAKHINLNILKDPEFYTKITKSLESRLGGINDSYISEVELQWREIKDSLMDTQENEMGYAQPNKKQPWITDNILRLMEERRKYKTRDNNRYKQLNREITNECRKAKEEWLEERCSEIEELQKKHDLFNLHKKIKDLTQKHQKRHLSILKDDNNKILVGIVDKLNQWRSHIEKLYNDNRPEDLPVGDASNEDSPSITKDEIRRAINIQKNGRAVGPDEIHSETLKLIAQADGDGLNLLTAFFNSIYRSGQIPTDWLRSVFVALPKKANASHCSDYRMISLMSHVLKVFLRIIHTRIYTKCEFEIGSTQFGFRNGVGTREAVFSLNVLTQRCRDMNVDVYACFIDYQRAFDCVSHEKLIRILRRTGIDEGDLRIITRLYWNQTAGVRVDGAQSEEVAIRRGVRQGCVLSPLLFNIYSEAVFREALEDTEHGIRINGTIINNIRFADDTVILASSMENLQNLMNLVVTHSANYGLQMNIVKTKLVVFSKMPRQACLLINGDQIQQVPATKYLGVVINRDNDPSVEVLSRIEQARKTFTQMRSFFVSRDISLGLRIRMLRCYVFPVLLYGAEAWTLSPSLDKRIEAFEMYIYRRMLRISWMQRVTNVEVLKRMNKEQELLKTVKVRKLQYIGHVIRGDRYKMLRLIMDGRIEGKRSVGRRQNSWTKDLRRWYGKKTSIEVFRAAASKVVTACWIANLR